MTNPFIDSENILLRSPEDFLMCGKAFGCRFDLTIANEGATMSDFQIGIARCERSNCQAALAQQGFQLAWPSQSPNRFPGRYNDPEETTPRFLPFVLDYPWKSR